jgi:cardiolipin synthase A/B
MRAISGIYESCQPYFFNIGVLSIHNMSLGRPDSSAAYTIRNRVQFVYGGKDYFNTLLELIKNTKKCIHLQFYIYENDETGWLVTHALIEAAQRKVDVYLQVDGYASQGISKKMAAELKAAGVNLKWFEPLFRSKHFYFGRRLHHKVVVADGLYSLVGGVNICNRYNDMPGEPAWLDTALYCEGEASYVLHHICRDMWNDKNLTPIDSSRIEAFCDYIPEDEQIMVRTRRNDWVKRKNQIWKTYYDIFTRAEKNITIMCSYFLPGRLFRRKLSQAVKRGVKVKVILAGPSDIMMAKHAERYLYDWLLRNKIEVYEYQETVLHAKLAVYDGKKVTIGSYNVNNISAYASLELNMDVENHSFAEFVENELEQIIKEHCKHITRENYISSTNIFKRIWQRFCYSFINNVLNLFTFYFRQE